MYSWSSRARPNTHLFETAPASHHHSRLFERTGLCWIATADTSHAKVHPSECKASAPHPIPLGLAESMPPVRAMIACARDRVIWQVWTLRGTVTVVATATRWTGWREPFPRLIEKRLVKKMPTARKKEAVSPMHGVGPCPGSQPQPWWSQYSILQKGETETTRSASLRNLGL